MSGFKHATVTISQAEYSRLHESAMRKRLERNANRDSRSQGELVDYHAVLSQMEERQAQLEAVIRSQEQDGNPIDEEAIQVLLDQNAVMYTRIASALSQSTVNLNDAVNGLSDRLYQEIHQDRDQFRLYLQSILATQDDYLNQELHRDRVANQWIDQCQLLLRFIAETYDFDRFAPGRLERVSRGLDLALANLAEGLLESSIQSAQQVFLELSDLQYELEQAMILWQAEYSRVYFAIDEMVDALNSNAQVSALGLQGEELPIQVNLEYWSQGRYGQLLEHTQGLMNYYVQEQGCLSLEDLARIDSNILPRIQESFETIIYEARFCALNSQLRMNIAERALEALEQHGFQLNLSGYSDEDMRMSFNAQLESPDGSQVEIQVVPTELSNRELSNELVMITNHPYLKTEHEARLRWEELNHSLKLFHLNVGPFEILSPSESILQNENGSVQNRLPKVTRLEK